LALDALWKLCLWLFLDGATVSVATPLLLLGARRLEPWQVAVAGGAASSAGSVVQLYALRWMLARQRPWTAPLLPTRRHVEDTLRRYPSVSFLAIAVARATPLPDAPLKIVAAVAGYPLSRYFLSALLGAVPYYYVLSLLGHRFRFPAWVFVAAAALLAGGLLLDRLGRSREARAQ